MKYNKLVRDLIIQIIEKKGGKATYHIADDAEYRSKLYEKLIEEAQELKSASAEKKMEELADVYEVLKAIEMLEELDPAEIEAVRLKKKEERGGFEKRIVLEES